MAWDGTHNKNAAPLTIIPGAPIDVSSVALRYGTWMQVRIPKPGTGDVEYIIVEISTDLHGVTRIYATEPLTVEPFDDDAWQPPIGD
jgi:hypothetical protein